MRALAITAREDGKPLLAEEITISLSSFPIKPTRWMAETGNPGTPAGIEGEAGALCAYGRCGIRASVCQPWGATRAVREERAAMARNRPS